MKPVTTLLIAALAQSANIFVAAECKWQQCWEITHNGAATGRKGSDMCKDTCRSERWRDRTVFYPDSWGCRMNDDYETDAEVVRNFYTCCEAQGSAYQYSNYDC